MIEPVAYQASPLQEFDFSKPTEWIEWIKRFERFRSASGLSKRDGESQLNTLLYSMGSKSDDILTTFVNKKNRFSRHSPLCLKKIVLML